MRAYLMTRGISRDYAFLGPGPEREWWTSLRGLTSFERPTLVLERVGEVWRAYLSGIPSARRDRVSTRIRHTLVIEGDGPGAPGVLEAIAAWLEEIAGAAGKLGENNALTAGLDAAFPEPLIEEAIRGEVSEPIADLIGGALRAIAPASLASAGDAADLDEPAWVAALESAAARRAFVARARALLEGSRDGAAMVLNLASEPAQAEAVAPGAPTCAVLLGGMPAAYSTPQPLQRKKASRPLAPAPAKRARAKGTLVWIAVAFVAANLAAAAYLSRIW